MIYAKFIPFDALDCKTFQSTYLFMIYVKDCYITGVILFCGLFFDYYPGLLHR